MLLAEIDGIRIETFRGDFGELHRMAVESWRDEYRMASFPDLFRPEFLRFHSDPAPPDHLIAAYDGDACVSFVAILPRTYVLRGRELKGALAGLLTSRRAYLRRGIAEAMIRSALPQNERHGYDLVTFYLETGHRSTRLFRKLRAQGLPIEPVRRVHPWIRIIDLRRIRANEGLPGWQLALLRGFGLGARPREASIPGVRPYRGADLSDCLRLVNRYAGRADLARAFTAPELARTLEHGDVARTLVLERGGRVVAFANWIRHVHVGADPAPWAWLAHAVADDLSPPDRRRFYAALLAHLRDDGCAGVVEFGMGYHPMGPLVANRFFPYPRSVTLYAWLLNPRVHLGEVQTFFDVQV